MDYRLYYRHIAVAKDIGYLPDKQQLVGNFREEIRPLDAVPNALEWFMGLSAFDISGIEIFIRKYGVLRWNWTHAGWTNDQTPSAPNLFYISIGDIKDSHAQFQKHWVLASTGKTQNLRAVCKWLSSQLASKSEVTTVPEWSEMWKLVQPKLAMQIQTDPKEGIEVRLIAGDLWQGLCWALLEKLTEENGLIRVCKNPLCRGRKYFVGKTKYCDPRCGKLVADRKYIRKIRGHNGGKPRNE